MLTVCGSLVQTDISQQLLDRLPWNVVWILLTHTFLSHSRSLVKHYPGSASRMTYKGEYKLAGLSLTVFCPGCFQPFSLSLHMSTPHCIHLHRVREGVAVQHFTFVLTDLEGSQRFGFCRLTNSTHTCLCILRYTRVRVCEWCRVNLMPGWALSTVMKTIFNLFDYSYLPWFEVFYKLLNNLADYLTKGQVSLHCLRVSTPFYEYHSHEDHHISPQTNEMKVLLAALYKQPVPLTAGSVTLQMVNLQ